MTSSQGIDIKDAIRAVAGVSGQNTSRYLFPSSPLTRTTLSQCFGLVNPLSAAAYFAPRLSISRALARESSVM